MEKESIIQEEVKSGLMQYGLNDIERLDYENLILDEFKEKSFEKDEDFVSEVKNRVQSFVPSVRLLQKSRTKLQQDNAKLSKDFEDYKKNNPQKEPEQPKTEPDTKQNNIENPKVDPALATLTESISALKKQIEDMQTQHQEELKRKEITDKKNAIIEKLKPKYNKSFHSTINVIANGFDFSSDDAEALFTNQISELAKENPVMLAKGNENKETGLAALNALTDALKKETEAESKKAEVLKQRLK